MHKRRRCVRCVVGPHIYCTEYCHTVYTSTDEMRPGCDRHWRTAGRATPAQAASETSAVRRQRRQSFLGFALSWSPSRGHAITCAAGMFELSSMEEFIAAMAARERLTHESRNDH